MDAVEILLMGVVGLSVLVFLILDSLDRDRALMRGVGRGGDAEKQASHEVLGGGSFQESGEREATDDPVNARSGEGAEGSCEDEFIDDWEGVERSELEKVFGEAIAYANSKKMNGGAGGGGGGIGDDVKLELYGLQKVALEGPCHESQPMALNLSARSKWNAWQKLGNMSEEMAMEKYIGLLSDAIPNWNADGDLRSKENVQGGEDER